MAYIYSVPDFWDRLQASGTGRRGGAGCWPWRTSGRTRRTCTTSSVPPPPGPAHPLLLLALPLATLLLLLLRDEPTTNTVEGARKVILRRWNPRKQHGLFHAHCGPSSLNLVSSDFATANLGHMHYGSV